MSSRWCAALPLELRTGLYILGRPVSEAGPLVTLPRVGGVLLRVGREYLPIGVDQKNDAPGLPTPPGEAWYSWEPPYGPLMANAGSWLKFLPPGWRACGLLARAEWFGEQPDYVMPERKTSEAGVLKKVFKA